MSLKIEFDRECLLLNKNAQEVKETTFKLLEVFFKLLYAQEEKFANWIEGFGRHGPKFFKALLWRYVLGLKSLPLMEEEQILLCDFVRSLGLQECSLLSGDKITSQLEAFLESNKIPKESASKLTGFVRHLQEVLLVEDRFVLQFRESPGRNQFFAIDGEPDFDSIGAEEFLDLRERSAGVAEACETRIDFSEVRDPSSSTENLKTFGQGYESLLNKIVERWKSSPDEWLRYFLEYSEKYSASSAVSTPEFMEVPDREKLESALESLPVISKIAVISPHGWFGQDNVLGRPDTGGQVVYILDQVKALEQALQQNLEAAGVSVTPKILVLTRLIPESDGTRSDQRLEQIEGTRNSWILRVPFRDARDKVMPDWISRFRIWPYLERFALDAKQELLAELAGAPDLVIGNYSDGNLVASLLSQEFDVLQCNIAHALEKSKYRSSDLNWQAMEEEYRFSLQYTADLIAMNRADFLVSSTEQEIAGTQFTPGQYESYQLFSLPGLYRVVDGLEVSHPKFNVVSPGVDESIYFPFAERENRSEQETSQLKARLISEEGEGVVGVLDEPDLPIIFTMARLDKIKNLTGLVEAFGQNAELQARANLIVVTRNLQAEYVTDEEEKQELDTMYELIERYRLKGKMRWVENSSRERGAEFYRIVADRRGVFVQPALFEAFGLTVLEAMVSGLPTFATQFGGPLETIQNGENGFWVDPTDNERLLKPVLEFLKRSEKEPDYWDRLSQAGIDRVHRAYTWPLYAKKLLRAARLYGLWNHAGVSDEKKRVADYCDSIYQNIFKPRASAMEGAGEES